MKTSIILQREYLSRVKKKSFIIMTLVAPLIMAGFLLVYSYMIFAEDKEERTIGIIDESMVLFESLKNDEYTKFELLTDVSLDNVKPLYEEKGYYAVLFIPSNVATSLKVQIYSASQPSQSVIMQIHRNISQYLEDRRLIDEGIDKATLESLKVNLTVDTIKWGEDGTLQKSSTDISMIIGYLSGFLIYMFIFMYGVQVMRGVIEEKTNRIVEVIVSSVRPFQLMLGKIIGIALVGLTQFLAWVVLIGIFYSLGMSLIGPDYDPTAIAAQPEVVTDIMQQGVVSDIPIATVQESSQLTDILGKLFGTINFPVMIFSFVFYFIGGYLLYASLFAAIGSAVDNETDTQQFMFPITIPLILGLMVMIQTIQNPEGQIAFWFSLIPFTSPIVMLGRIPFGVPYWEIGLSMGLLVITFLLTVWLAGKIYRTGILMYGKKPSYAELWKWVRYRG